MFLRKLDHAEGKRQELKYKQMLDNMPEYDLTRIVKEVVHLIEVWEIITKFLAEVPNVPIGSS